MRLVKLRADILLKNSPLTAEHNENQPDDAGVRERRESEDHDK